jgi:Retrotransposon gag protein
MVDQDIQMADPIAALTAQMQTLMTVVLDLQQRLEPQVTQAAAASAGGPTEPTPPPDHGLSAKQPDPEIYYGDKEKLEPFIALVTLKLTVNRDRYPTEPERVAYAISRLGGDALGQIVPFIANGTDLDRLPTLDFIFEILRRAYGVSDRHAESVRKLRNLKQKNREFIAYYAEFERYMADCDYSDQAKVDCLLFGLNQELLNALSTQPAIPRNFPELVQLLINIDSAQRYLGEIRSANQPWRTQPAPRPTQPTPPAYIPRAASTPAGDPMDLDAARQTERERRRILGLCFYCGESNHAARSCPRKRARGPRLQVQAEN